MKLAVKTYHRYGLPAAKRYVEDAFTRRRFRVAALDEYLDLLSAYDGSFDAGVTDVVAINDRILLPLVAGVELSGEVGRVDLTAAGYAVWIFEQHERDEWEKELRFPLIQSYYAEKFRAPVDEVAVGVYTFRMAAYSARTYNAQEVGRARIEARRIAQNLLGAV